jgi:thiol-disulfide isomerase/thioredoxin
MISVKTITGFFFAFISVIVAQSASANRFSSPHGTVTISGKLKLTGDHDTIQLQYFEYFFWTNERNDAKVYTVISKTGEFKFALPGISEPGYVSIKTSPGTRQEKNIINLFMIEPDDNITINDLGDSLAFAGKGAGKFSCEYALAKTIDFKDIFLVKHIPVGEKDEYWLYHRQYDFYWNWLEDQKRISDSILSLRLAVLDKFEEKLRDKPYHLMKIDINGEQLFYNYYNLRQYYTSNVEHFIKPITDFYIKYYQNSLVDTSQAGLLILSKFYGDGIVQKAKFDVEIRESNYQDVVKIYSFHGLYELLSTAYSGVLRERVVAGALHELFNFKEGTDEYVLPSIATIRNPYFKNMLIELKNANLKGATVYPFELLDSNGMIRKAQDFAGKVMVVDFWFTGCGACRHVADGMKVVSHDFANNDKVVFITVSVDQDTSKWKNTLRNGMYTTKEDINLYTNGQGSMHPMVLFYAMPGFPQLFIVDKNGKMFTSHPEWPWDADKKQVETFESQINEAINN